MQSINKNGIAALYCRLSRDDGTDSESNSIGNQKKMLKQKAKEYGFQNVKYYVDDGYTGTNFNRPGFQAMLEDIEMGYISVVMVKDLSRLGRDYVSVGQYTDSYFPEHDIRFIAVNDLVDSDEGENEIAPFKNVMNEMYARDISRKVRSAHRIRGNLGEPLAQPPYGYMKDPENSKRWIIDEEAAENVRLIFKLCLEGKGNESIAHILQDRKVLVPMAYWRSKGLNRGGKKTQSNPYKWCASSVRKVLTQQEYCGDVINFRTYSKNFKNKRRIPNDPEKWKIFENVHEPIIDRETFETVQEHMQRSKRRAPNKEHAEKNMFCGLVYCADCGHPLWFNVNHPNTDIHYFMCSNYKGRRGTCEGTHYIRADFLEQVVSAELNRIAEYLVEDEERFAAILENKTDKTAAEQRKRTEEKITRSEIRIGEIDVLYERLYEDNVKGKVSDAAFMRQSQRYEEERDTLRMTIKDLKTELRDLEKKTKNNTQFTKLIRSFMEMKHLTAPLLKELIDKIEVHNIEGKGKNRVQRITIYYRFIGTLDLPATEKQEPLRFDTREGVAVSYLTDAKSA